MVDKVDNYLVKQLREAYNLNRKVARGVYLVNDNVVAKSREPDRKEEEFMFSEYHTGQFLYDNGVSVPKMFGVVQPDFITAPFRRAALDKFFLLMERVPGMHIRQLDDDLLEEATEKFRAEIIKVLELGIYPSDTPNSNNVIFDPQKRRAYLIDFEGWDERRSEEAFQKLYKYITTEKNLFSRPRAHPAASGQPI